MTTIRNKDVPVCAECVHHLRLANMRGSFDHCCAYFSRLSKNVVTGAIEYADDDRIRCEAARSEWHSSSGCGLEAKHFVPQAPDNPLGSRT